MGTDVEILTADAGDLPFFPATSGKRVDLRCLRDNWPVASCCVHGAAKRISGALRLNRLVNWTASPGPNLLILLEETDWGLPGVSRIQTPTYSRQIQSSVFSSISDLRVAPATRSSGTS